MNRRFRSKSELSRLLADKRAAANHRLQLVEKLRTVSIDHSDLKSVPACASSPSEAMDYRFARLEAKIDDKPGAGTIRQAAMGIFTGMFAVMIGTIIALKTLGYIG
jgi:hypothetical protein